MKTSLDFEGPADLSVGEIRISGSKGVEQTWMATPGQRGFKSDKIAPGYYIAEISPAGTPSQSVVFEVKPGANTVILPDFNALAANGSGVNFLDIQDREDAAKSIYAFTADKAIDSAAQTTSLSSDPALELESGNLSRPLIAEERIVEVPDRAKLITVGLAIEQLGKRESWRQFDGSCSAQVSGGRLAIEIAPPADWTPDFARRVRMSVAIQDVRVERLLLPLYRGGTSVGITSSFLSPNDVTLEVLPVDPNIRAIWRALEAGTLEHAIAVRDHVLTIKGDQPVNSGQRADPWEKMLAGLLFLRFPEAFPKLSPAWAEKLCKDYSWAADVFVIRARQLSNDAGATPGDVLKSAEESVKLLVKAQSRGSPYFNQSNQFFNELVGSLARYEELSSEAHNKIENARRRWQREAPLQRSAGVSFSWLSRDPQLLKEQGVLAPKRNPSGRLTSRDTAIVFKGRLSGGTIVFESQQREAPKAAKGEPSLVRSNMAGKSAGGADSAMPLDCPALNRAPGPADDPNKGRFGRKAEVQGFRLSAQFGEGNAKMRSVTLLVEADEKIAPDIGEGVWLCLHPTFNPEWVRVLFRGRSATLTVTASGGFTVGAWIPSREVELECDLAELPDAPQIIREL